MLRQAVNVTTCIGPALRVGQHGGDGGSGSGSGLDADSGTTVAVADSYQWFLVRRGRDARGWAVARG